MPPFQIVISKTPYSPLIIIAGQEREWAAFCVGEETQGFILLLLSFRCATLL